MKFVKSKFRKGGEASDTDGQYDEDVDTVDGVKTKDKCKHRSIANYACLNPECNWKMTKFGTYFDSGIIPRYMRILRLSDSEECAEQLNRPLDVIFEAYNPKNIV